VILVAGLVLGACCTFLLHAGTRSVFARPTFLRENYRGVALPTAVGLLVPMAATFVLAGALALRTLGWDGDVAALTSLQLTVTATLGFGLLGLLDDVAADSGSSGYRGHLAALLSGRLTAGSLKMVTGPVVALVVVAPVAGDSAVRLLLDGALVALAANLANLFDRAPGRVIKVSLLAAVAVVVAAGASTALLGLAVVGGAALALLVPDLRERLMVGDAGSNPLGATVGLAVVLTASPLTRTVVVGVLLALNLLSERVSFSAVIARTPLLRWLDLLGRTAAES
jgi:UDP-GlcNAc:undecaprenyl-phosphate GlcNAc-1-phosphate transferase